MLGAILGDIAGSTYEFDNIKEKDFKLFEPHKYHGNPCCFTDDTVMTCAVADALVNKKDVAETLRYWARKFPRAGYGGMFYNWALWSNSMGPYNSCGNGSAMRVSSAAYLGNSEEEVTKLAIKSAEVTHNHPEGIKGAIVTAMCIFMARKGKNKQDIYDFAVQFYPILSKLNYEQLRRTYEHTDEICQKTVPQAIYCFLESKNFVDCLKTVISIGGDCDTTGAIAGAIAEAYYGIPNSILNKLSNFFILKEEKALLRPIMQIYKKCGIKYRNKFLNTL